ncbi:M48 family metallopeptidase [Rhodopseudomonas palustris]|uniref:M48 family metallopeptidase n=1 Tax=Rhodopseudomonas palustris TaxID=1076 RepID=A0AAX3DZP9_RHOPL|nr:MULTISPECIES: SprT family zinc-dependent metalloprotease [Rhodopseudomonas]NEW97103.1 M48 family peptidase [Rhodopseudomonas sp. BR0G17]UYO40295.1 M48 family metallopeptidase [Rhodopseudomonas palustris]UYO45019.1 M48 family metallopeptidase [Rhodopseudomonas palustris]UYO49601.1 M48 family metallopeptidase [Rhodopseudomonas palustris]
MICFCAERFPWRRLWQIPGDLLFPGPADMARALLYRRPTEPSTIPVRHGSQFFAVRIRRHRRARRYTLRIHPSDREAILTMPPRGTLADAKEFAQRHGAWIAARLGRLPKAAPFLPGTLVPLRGQDHKIVHRAGRGTVWTEVRESGEKILCVAGETEHIERRVLDFLKREARRDLQKACDRYAPELGVKVTRLSIRDQSSRWGSCTSAGSLSFSWRLILAPPYVLDYLAAHEVAHLVEMNHSARFWRVVGKVCPQMERAKTWLDSYGNDLHRYGISD